MNQLYKPDQASYRRAYEVELEFMKEVVKTSGNGSDIGANLGLNLRFFEQWRDGLRDDASRILGNKGEADFSRDFSNALRRAKAWIQTIVREYLSHLATVVDPIDEVASAGVSDLARWSRGDLGIMKPNGTFDDDLASVCSVADSWGDDHELIPEESLRELTLASKICRLEAVDPWEYVTLDMAKINEISTERVWSGRKIMLTVNYAVRRLGKYRGYVHPSVPLTFGEDRASVPDDAIGKTIRMKCRVVKDGQKTYLVLTKSRPKEIEATILKEEEPDPSAPTQRRAARDRRGIMNVVVGVGVNGVWRAATPEDSEKFSDLVRLRLWREPLVLSEHTQWQNPERSSDYRRVKLLGRLRRDSFAGGPLLVATSVEHQIIDVGTLLSSLGAKTTLNHDIYRAARIRRVLVPKLFGGNIDQLDRLGGP